MKHTEKKRESVAGRERGGFLSGVFVLSVSTILVKLIGLAYKIPMLSYLGAEGMGYFNSAYEIYALLCVISTAGLPVALSLLIAAEEEKGGVSAGYCVNRIYRCALGIFMAFGCVGALLLSCFAYRLALAIGNPLAEACILAIAPALVFVCFSGAVRGYFQGYRKMLPTALSQLLEAVGKLAFGIWFASYALKKGYEIPIVAAFAVAGLTLGTALSAGYLLFCRLREKRRAGREGRFEEQKGYRAFGTLIKIAFPITVSSAVLSVTRLLDMALILRRLEGIGVSMARANEIYGAYTTLALPVFSLIPALVTPVSLSLLPRLSAAVEGGNHRAQTQVVSDSLRLTVLLAMPASFGIALYATPILSLLFAGQSQAVAVAAPLLSVLGPSVLFSCLITTTNAVLQAYRRTGLPILSMAVGAAVKALSAWILIGNPDVGVYGAPVSTFLCNLTVILMNMIFLYRLVPHAGEALRIFFRPFAASVCSLGISYAVYFLLLFRHPALAFPVAFVIAVPAYLFFALLTRSVTKEDLLLIPGVRRLGFLREEKTKTKETAAFSEPPPKRKES